MGKEVILLAMHGAPPVDFPSSDLAELFCLRARMLISNGPEQALYERQCGKLEAKMRAWLRNASNDRFYFGSLDLARHLSRATGLEVVLGFIEFTSPGLEEAIEQAVQPGTERVIVHYGRWCNWRYHGFQGRGHGNHRSLPDIVNRRVPVME